MKKTIKVIGRILIATKKPLYKMGARPKRGSVFYSPSLDFMYTLKGLKLDKAFQKAFGKKR